MNITDLLSSHTFPFTIIFVRVASIFAMTPIFNLNEIPFLMKGWIAAAIAMVIYPFCAPHVAVYTDMTPAYLLNLFDSAIVGILIGLFIQVYYTAFLMAGEFYSLQLGFGIVNVVDPLSASSIPILGQIKSLFALMVFIMLGGHRFVIEGMVTSFRYVPFLTLSAAKPLAAGMVGAMREMFIIGFKLAAPMMGTIFLVELVLGILSKIAPQMNIMVAGFQIKIVTGLFLLFLMVPVIFGTADRTFDRSFAAVRSVLRSMAQ